MKRIWWLASYPKSGNTWFRAFLTALLARDPEGSLLDTLEGGPIASSSEVFDLETGIDSCELTFAEIQAIRPDVFRSYARRATEPLYLKIHDARIDPETGVDLAPAEVTRGAIYLLRNPLDVAVSWAHHCCASIEKGAAGLLKARYSIASKDGRGSDGQVRQTLGCWSGHARSWIDQDSFPTLALRYEDMLADPARAFGRAAAFLELDKGPEEIARAIKETAFDTLQRLESERGFAERPSLSKQFFRKGRAGSWREELPEEWSRKLIDAHGETMRRFGYLDEKGAPTY